MRVHVSARVRVSLPARIAVQLEHGICVGVKGQRGTIFITDLPVSRKDPGATKANPAPLEANGVTVWAWFGLVSVPPYPARELFSSI